MYMSPAGEEKKQRGAAGPGEAIFAFLFNGKKPVVGDLDLGGVGVELKKDEGRIGKGSKLPNTKIEKEKLFKKSYDANSFWNELIIITDTI